jgi:hypothetical protein
MPSGLHETFIRNIDYEIHFQLRALAAGIDSAADFARSIQPTGSLQIKFEITGEPGSQAASAEAKPLLHEPDASFSYLHAKYPGVVLEVSYSQKKKDLSRLADDYIIQSDGNIQIVVALDIEYQGSKKATLSVWRPQVVINERDGQEELIAAQVEDKVRCSVILIELATKSLGISERRRDPSNVDCITASTERLCPQVSDRLLFSSK